MRQENTIVRDRWRAPAWLALAAALIAASIAVGVVSWTGCSRKIDEIRAVDLAIVESLPDVAVDPQDAPWWRGLGQNATSETPGPLRWSLESGSAAQVAWRATPPGRGHASPCIWGDQVFISTADEEQEVMLLVCYGRADGVERWRCEMFRGGFMRRHESNTQASATPACDGQRVFVPQMVSGAIRLAAVDMAGRLAWTTEAGPFQSEHGYGASPVLWKSLVIVAGDSGAGSFLTAVHRETGRLIWRTPRTSGSSYQSPMIATLGGRPQLLIGGRQKVVSYDPDTGEELWSAAGPADTMANTIAVSADVVVASGGYPQNGVWALDASGKILWKQRFKLYVPSPLISGPRVYVAGDDGVLRCLALADGSVLWTQRLSGAVTASPVRAGSHVYVATEKGDVYVLKDGDRFEQSALNKGLGGCFATPVFAGGELFLRTDTTLYCIERPPRSPTGESVDSVGGA